MLYQMTVSMLLLSSHQSWSALPTLSKLSWACSAALVDSALCLLKHPKGTVGLSLVIPQVLRDHSELSVSPLSTSHHLMQVASWLADVGSKRDALILVSHREELFSKLLGFICRK